MKILLLEDDIALNRSIKTLLKMYDHSVDSFTNGELAIDAIDVQYDIYILDVHVSGVTGVDVLDAIRLFDKSVPVIMISADINIEVIMQSYALGCNDFLKKPFDIRELKIKLDHFSNNIEKVVMIEEDLLFDVKHEVLYHEDRKIRLTKKEKELLKVLLKDKGFNVTHERIIDHVWNDGADVNLDSIRSIISRLRQKLPYDIIIGNVGQGYSIE